MLDAVLCVYALVLCAALHDVLRIIVLTVRIAIGSICLRFSSTHRSKWFIVLFRHGVHNGQQQYNNSRLVCWCVGFLRPPVPTVAFHLCAVHARGFVH